LKYDEFQVFRLEVENSILKEHVPPEVLESIQQDLKAVTATSQP
jgi:hypothetical protein